MSTNQTQEHKGAYSGLDHVVASTKEIPNKLKFYIATTKEMDSDTGEMTYFHNLIPDNWVSLNKTHFLNPPSDNHTCNNGPANWTHAIFRRNYYPRSGWTEHFVENFLFDHSSKDNEILFGLLLWRYHLTYHLLKYFFIKIFVVEHCYASAALKKLLAGVRPENITDCDAPLEKKARRTKRRRNPYSNESDSDNQNPVLNSKSM